jgi:hypothetical protein
MDAVAYLYNVPSHYDREDVKERITEQGIPRDAIDSVYLPQGSTTARIYFTFPHDAQAFVDRINQKHTPGHAGKRLSARLHDPSLPLPSLTKARPSAHDAGRRVVIEQSPPPPFPSAVTGTPSPPTHVATPVVAAYVNAAGMIEITPDMFQQYQRAWILVQQIIQHQQRLSQPNV